MVAFDGSGLAQQPAKHGRPSQPFGYRRPSMHSEQHRRPSIQLPLATDVPANQGRHSEQHRRPSILLPLARDVPANQRRKHRRPCSMLPLKTDVPDNQGRP